MKIAHCALSDSPYTDLSRKLLLANILKILSNIEEVVR